MANTVEIILKALDQTKGGFNSATKNLKGFQDTAGAVAKVAITAFAATGTAVIAMAKNLGDTAEELLNFSERTGIAVEEAGRLKFVSQEIGVSFEQLEKGLRKGSEEATRAGQTLSEFLLAQADRFSQYEDGASKSTEAQRLFGKSGSELIPILNKGSAALREQLAQADKFTTVFGRESASNIAAFSDNIERVGSVIRKNIEEALLKASPQLLTLSENILELSIQFTKLEGDATSSASAISVIADGLGLLVKGVNYAATAIKGLGDVLASAFLFPTENNEGAKQAVEDLKTAWEGVGQAKEQATKTPEPEKLQIGRIMADPKDLEKYQRLYADLQNSQLRGSAVLIADAEEKHQRRIAQIQELKIEEEQKNQFISESSRALENERFELERNGILLLADLEAQRTAASIQGTMQILQGEQAANLARLEGNRAVVDVYTEQWRIAHRTIEEFAATMFGSFSSNFGNAISNVITMTESAGQAFKNLGKAMIKSVADYVGQWIAAQITLRAMQAVFGASTAATTVGVASTIGAAWAPAAALASLASFGSNAGPANAAIASTIAFSKASSVFGGIAHGGLDYVPRESTYLLDKGERVLSPSQNEAFTSWMDGGGGGTSVVSVYLDGEVLARGLGRMSADGRLVLSAKAIS